MQQIQEEGEDEEGEFPRIRIAQFMRGKLPKDPGWKGWSFVTFEPGNLREFRKRGSVGLPMFPLNTKSVGLIFGTDFVVIFGF